MPYPTQFPTATNSDGASILDISQNQITVLKPTGEFIWTRLQRGVAVEDAISELAALTNTGRDVVALGTHRFLERLAAEQLFDLKR